MRLKQMDEFRRDAARIALASRRARKQVTDDLGVDCPAGGRKAICRAGGGRH